MTGDAERGAPAGGPLDHLRELLGAGVEYLSARLRLAGIEAKEALLHFGILIALAVALVAVLVFGYLFLCFAIAALLAWALRIEVGWILLVIALGHFAVALVCALIIKTRITAAVFTETISELRRDRQWLTRK